MATLHVRNVPEKLYKRIQKLAQIENRSITAEVIQLLAQGLQAHEVRQDKVAIIERICQRTRKMELPGDWTDSTELIAKDPSR